MVEHALQFSTQAFPTYMPGVQFKAGYKFADLALAHPWARVELAPMLPVGDHVALSRTLPKGALETWEDTIGRLHRSELEEESLFV